MMSLSFANAKLDIFLKDRRSKDEESHVNRIRDMFHFNKGGKYLILDCHIVSDPEVVILLSAWINYKKLIATKRTMYGEGGYSFPGFEEFLKSVTKVSDNDMEEGIL